MAQQVRLVGEVCGEALGCEVSRFELPLTAGKKNVVFVLRVPNEHAAEFGDALRDQFQVVVDTMSNDEMRCHAITMSDAYTLDVLAVEEVVG